MRKFAYLHVEVNFDRSVGQERGEFQQGLYRGHEIDPFVQPRPGEDRSVVSSSLATSGGLRILGFSFAQAFQSFATLFENRLIVHGLLRL